MKLRILIILMILSSSIYELIQIIIQNGKVIREQKNNNTIQVSDLPKGGYFALTSSNEYFQFIKF